ncbi:hypothetical protein PR048_020634 [Dryococelus australis]|uniref:Uncharacterized protein n=1 Tax=Dryococelus australis TaxID=614101 RepID=A0ABQ9H6V8_9NEOP|nr:hypothetical protein PR048_020634 [Dryococelus australis]
MASSTTRTFNNDPAAAGRLYKRNVPLCLTIARRQPHTGREQAVYTLHCSQGHSPGNSTPINEHLTFVCPNHVQVTQKGSDFTYRRQPMGKRRRLEDLKEVSNYERANSTSDKLTYMKAVHDKTSPEIVRPLARAKCIVSALSPIVPRGVISAALNSEVLRVDECGARWEWEEGRKWEIPTKTHNPAASSGTNPTCEYLGATTTGNEPGSPWWEASSLTTTPVRLLMTEGPHNWQIERGFQFVPWCGMHPGMKGRGKREIPEKTHRPVASSDARKFGSDPAGDWIRFALVGCHKQAWHRYKTHKQAWHRYKPLKQAWHRYKIHKQAWYRYKTHKQAWHRYKPLKQAWHRYKTHKQAWHRYKPLKQAWHRYKIHKQAWYRYKTHKQAWHRYKPLKQAWHRYKTHKQAWHRYKPLKQAWHRYKIHKQAWYRYKTHKQAWHRYKPLKQAWHRYKTHKQAWHRYKPLKQAWHRYKIHKQAWYRYKIHKQAWHRYKIHK